MLRCGACGLTISEGGESANIFIVLNRLLAAICSFIISPPWNCIIQRDPEGCTRHPAAQWSCGQMGQLVHGILWLTNMKQFEKIRREWVVHWYLHYHIISMGLGRAIQAENLFLYSSVQLLGQEGYTILTIWSGVSVFMVLCYCNNEGKSKHLAENISYSL